MSADVLDPGPDWTWPHARDHDGYLDEARVPCTPHRQRSPDGTVVLIDPMPSVRDQLGVLRRLDEVVPRRPRP